MPKKRKDNITTLVADGLFRFVIAPLDVVKIRLQLQSHPLSDAPSREDLRRGGPIYRGTVSTVRHILRHEGLTGLWKGNVPAELMYVCYSAVQFTTYRAVTMILRAARLPDAAESFVAGAAAGAAATACTYPLDLLRTRFAAQGHDDRVYRNLRAAVVQMHRAEGPHGFFRGLGPALAQVIPYMGIFFAAYETLRGPLGRELGGGDALAGMMASVAAKTCTFPLDLVRKRIQVQGPTRGRYVHKNIPEYSRGAARALQTILATEGLRGLYRGLTVSLLKAAPASAVTMWTYEQSLRVYKGLARDKEEEGAM